MTINDRVKVVRSQFGLTQIEFGGKTGISQGHLTSIENGKRAVTEKTLKVICATFNVNEEWLRTGEGDMFVEDDNVLLSQLAKKYNLDDFGQKFMEVFLGLSEEQRKAVLSYASFLASKASNAEFSAELAHAPRYELSDPAAVDVDTETASYRQELEDQKKAAENSSALDGAKDA
ncbi:MAG: helix-turn-helix domain-containing protein [Intestinimonas sp.]|jgi:transcriptional regulator with XRE-family HTH domain|nr:helix-turn-helix domain-containing protein [Intestinimonas sp.]